MVTAEPPPRRSVRIPRWLVLALAGAVLIAGALVIAPRLVPPPDLPSLAESRRRIAGIQLARYAAREAHGTFLPPGALTLAVHEQFLQR